MLNNNVHPIFAGILNQHFPKPPEQIQTFWSELLAPPPTDLNQTVIDMVAYFLRHDIAFVFRKYALNLAIVSLLNLKKLYRSK